MTKCWKPPVTGTVKLERLVVHAELDNASTAAVAAADQASTANVPGFLTSNSHDAQSSARTQ